MSMKVPSNSIKDIRSYYKSQLIDFYPENEADVLLFRVLEEYTGLARMQVLMDPDFRITESELLKIHFAVKDLKNFRPIQYILGKTEFYGCTIHVNQGVLIPRPETEELVDYIIKEMDKSKPLSILDIGTGSGAIAIALKKECPLADLMAIDISQQAIKVAKENAKINQQAIKFYIKDILSPNQSDVGTFDLIVSNPPYVRFSEKKEMKPNVLNYEPSLALFVEDNDPLVFYEAIAGYALKHLKEGGVVYCEINQYLSEESEKLFYQKGFKNVLIKKDMNNNFRFLKAKI